MVQHANRPGVPENDVRLRLAAAGAVVTGIAACHAEHEISGLVALCTGTLVVGGMAFSYATRRRPWAWVKPTLALAVVGGFAWLFLRLTTGTVTDINGIDGPLAALFAWIQVTHAFDVPARRDLTFSLVGSASLMAVAGAQAVDSSFGLFVVLWLAFGAWGLLGIWRSASDGGRVGGRGLTAALVAAGAVAILVMAVLPAPRASGNVPFPDAAAPGARPLGGRAQVSGDGQRPGEPARAGSPGGPTRVGGFLGFAHHLDTALRGSLGNQVVMHVRAQRPTFWIGETFDTWDGRSWGTSGRHMRAVDGGSPFAIDPAQGDTSGGPSDLQTFYLAAYGPNLLFHAADARAVWFPSGRLYAGNDGTLVAPQTMGPGTIYTVDSTVVQATPAELRAAGGSPFGLASGGVDTRLPHPYPRVQALAEAVTAGQRTTYDRVQALIGWIAAHTHYSTDIPPLPAGSNTVDDFLFGSRTGFCEQISTSLAVMLRTLGIPAREAVGYVPGPFNPLTDLYDVQARDAHAWVQVWFPGIGWQSFDPTASVPLANPSPGAALAHDAVGALRRVPWVPTGIATVAAAAVALVLRWYRRRPPSWELAMAKRIQRAGSRAGRRRAPSETLASYAAALDARRSDGRHPASALAEIVESSAYGGIAPAADVRHRMEAAARRLRVPRAAQLEVAANASASDVPVSSSRW